MKDATIEFLALGGFAIRAESEGLDLSNRGGEIRLRAMASERGFSVSEAERSAAQIVVFEASELEDVERYLTWDVGNASIRPATRLPLVGQGRDLPVAAGVTVEPDVERLAVHFTVVADPLRRVTLDNRPLMVNEFSHALTASLDELRASLLNPTTQPVWPPRTDVGTHDGAAAGNVSRSSGRGRSLPWR